MVVEQKQNFDKESEVYTEMLENGIKNTGFSFDYIQEYKVLDLKEEVKKYTNPENELKILDFGCGIGLVTQYLRKHFPNSTLYACDYSKKSIEKCMERNKNIQNLHIMPTNGSDIPFAEKFDIIFIANVVRHISRPNQKIIFDNLYNSLAENGRIMMYEFNPLNPVSLYFYYKEDRQYDPENVRIMSAGYSRKLFKSANFKDIKTKYRFFVPSSLKKLLWIEKYLKKCPIGANYYLIAKK